MCLIKYLILSLVKAFQIVLIVALLSSCGFQLRGMDISELESVSVTGPVGGEVRRVLSQSLEDHGVKIVAPGSNVVDIRLIDVRTSRRPVSTSARIDAAQYELRLELDVSLMLDSRSIANGISLSAGRIYSVDSLNLSGSYEEQKILMSEINDEVAVMIIDRLEAWLDNRRV